MEGNNSIKERRLNSAHQIHSKTSLSLEAPNNNGTHVSYDYALKHTARNANSQPNAWTYVADDGMMKKPGGPIVRRTLAVLAGLCLFVTVAYAYRFLPLDAWNTPRDLTASASKYSYFIAQNLYNSEHLFPEFSDRLIETIHKLGKDNVFVSIFESGSTDLTPEHLEELEDRLTQMGVKNEIVTIRRGWKDFCFAIERDCQQLHGGLRSTPSSVRISILSIFRNMALRPLYLSPYILSRTNPLDAASQNNIALRIKQLLPYLWESSEETRMDKLQEFPKEFREFMQASRVADLKHKWLWQFDKYPSNLGFKRPLVVIFINDILLNVEDIVSLVNTNKGPDFYDMSCGMDFEEFKFYDTWVARDIKGLSFSSWYPYVREPETQSLLRQEQPFPVYSCWNGAVTIHADILIANEIMLRAARAYEDRSPNPLLSNAKIRQQLEGTSTSPRLMSYSSGGCAASECQLICKDLWSVGASRILMNPQVKIYYNQFTKFVQTLVLPFLNRFLFSWANRIHAIHPSLRVKQTHCTNVYAAKADARVVNALLDSSSRNRIDPPAVWFEEEAMNSLKLIRWLHPQYAEQSVSVKTSWYSRLHTYQPPYDGGKVTAYQSPLIVSCGGEGEDFCSQRPFKKPTRSFLRKNSRNSLLASQKPI